MRTARRILVRAPRSEHDHFLIYAANLYIMWQAWEKAETIKVDSAALFSPAGSSAIYCRRPREGEKGEASYGYEDEDRSIRKEERERRRL